MDAIALRIQLLNTFEALLAELTGFCAAVRRDRKLPVWVSRSEAELDEHLDMRAKAIRLYSALWYRDGQDGRETLTCPGIVGAGPDTLEAAARLHAAKDAFKAAVLALKGLARTEANSIMADLHRRNEEVADAMEHMGAARLNLKQAYRHVPVLERRPQKIGFTWSRHGRTIQRTSPEEARRLLERRADTPQTHLERRRLAALPASETLARIRSVVPHLRANVVFHDPKGGVQRRLIQAPLPILVPLTPGQALPEFVPVSPQPTGTPRLQRSDKRIEEEAFLPSIRIHRYREPYRQP